MQIAIVRYENGKEARKYVQYFMPKKKFTKDARKLTGLDKIKLKAKGAKPFTVGASEKIMNFLKEKPD